MKRAALPLMLALAHPANAEDVALVITNPDIAGRATAQQMSQDHDRLITAYRDKGYRVFSGEDADRREMLNLMRNIAEETASDPSGRVVLHFTGAVAAVGDQIFLVPDNLDASTSLDIAFDAVPLGALTDLAEARRDNGTVILAGVPATGGVLAANPADLRGLSPDDGVLAINGPFRVVNDVVRQELLGQGRSVASVAEQNRNVNFAGRVTARTTLAEAATGAGSAEETMWSLAQESRSELMIRAYLERFPNGSHADEARQLLSAEPGQLDEQALALTRDERKEIQRQLTILGYDTRGIDGIFGPGTRGSFREWQRKAGFDTTGYLTAPQLRRLDADVEQREAEIREEERLARIADDDYWSRTGASLIEEDLRRYLDRYPNGVHSQEAQEELDRIEEAKLSDAEREDRDAWNQAKDINTIQSFEDYIARFPNGQFVENARARIENKRGRDTSKLQAEERALGMNSASLAVLELRLASLGYKVGTADGKITGQTRQAIGAFQKRVNLPSTGYLNKATVQKLLLSVF